MQGQGTRQRHGQPVQPERDRQLAHVQHRRRRAHAVRPAEQPSSVIAQPRDRRARAVADPRHASTRTARCSLVNRDGFIFGAGAVINTAGFLATTSDIKNDDFMAGRYNFNIPGRPDASIVNMGTITATSGGFAALVAPGVRNSGTITANLGTVALAAGNTFSLDFYGDKLITLGVERPDRRPGEGRRDRRRRSSRWSPTRASSSANGGRVELTAAAARQRGRFGDQYQRRDRGELGRHEERPDRARRAHDRRPPRAPARRSRP